MNGQGQPLPLVSIHQQSDGWRIEVNNRSYSWNHNEPDLGVFALQVFLSDLGFNTELVEEY